MVLQNLNKDNMPIKQFGEHHFKSANLLLAPATIR